MKFNFLSLFLGLVLASAVLTTRLYANDISITTTVTPSPQVDFAWSGSKSFTIDRRILGQTLASDWERAGQATNTTSFTDTAVPATGTTYEYRLYNDTQITVVTASFAAALEDQKGGVILVVDSSSMDELAGDLEQFEMDLVGDGWFVKRINFAPHGTGTPQDLKAEIQALCTANPGITSLFLCGDVPVASSGYLAPDGHSARPHETDTYYADLDGNWTDNGTYGTTKNVPGDGQFDQSYFPTSMELETGRVAFNNMSSSRKWSNDLLRDYLHKNHSWRHAMKPVSYKAAGGDYFYHGLWRDWLSTMLGPANAVTSNGYTLSRTEPLLFVVGRGGDGVNPINPSQAIIMSNFQSYRQEWYDDNNPNMENVAQTDWGLNSMWGARPQYFLHALAAGKTIGYAFKQNLNELVKSTSQRSFHSVNTGSGVINFGGNGAYSYNWVSCNLLGDPTIRVHPVLPPQNLQATKSGNQVNLTWSASQASDLQGYHVYRSTERLGVYTRLTSSLTTDTSWSDPSAPAGDIYYQVRAVNLSTYPTGSYYNQSQGLFVLVNADGSVNQAPTASNFQLQGKCNTPLQFAFQGSDPDGDTLTPIILQHPQSGYLRFWKGQWFYVSSGNYVGSDSVTFAMSDGVNVSQPATLSIEVDEVGKTLLAWDFPDGGNAPESTFHAPNILPASISVSGYGLINSFPNNDQFSFRFIEATKGRYATWTLAPIAGHKMNLEKMHFAACAQPDTELTFEVRASTDNFTTSFEIPVRSGNSFVGIGTKSRNRGDTQWLDLDTVPELQGVEDPVQFRIYFWRSNGGSSSDVMCLGKMTEAAGYTDAVEDISITGTVVKSDDSPNQAPLGNPDTYTALQETILTVDQGAGVLSNDSDPDGNGLQAFIVTAPSYGQVILNSDGSFTYTPESGYTGTDNFSYRLSDGNAFSGPYTVQLQVWNHAQKWRDQWFENPANTGDGANDATPAGDGITNLMKFATSDGTVDPKLPGKMPGTLTPGASGEPMVFTYTRNTSAMAAGVLYAVKWSDTLESTDWSRVGVGPESVLELGTTQEVTVTVPRGQSDHRFVRLVVSETPLPEDVVEVILDNNSASGVSAVGGWTTSSSTSGYFGANYLHDGDTGKGTKSVTFTPVLPQNGDYAVYARWTAATTRANNVPIDIVSLDGTDSVAVDQTQNNGVWVQLGIYRLNAGSGGTVTISNTGTTGHVIVDAVKWVLLP